MERWWSRHVGVPFRTSGKEYICCTGNQDGVLCPFPLAPALNWQWIRATPKAPRRRPAAWEAGQHDSPGQSASNGRERGRAALPSPGRSRPGEPQARFQFRCAGFPHRFACGSSRTADCYVELGRPRCSSHTAGHHGQGLLAIAGRCSRRPCGISFRLP